MTFCANPANGLSAFSPLPEEPFRVQVPVDFRPRSTWDGEQTIAKLRAELPDRTAERDYFRGEYEAAKLTFTPENLLRAKQIVELAEVTVEGLEAKIAKLDGVLAAMRAQDAQKAEAHGPLFAAAIAARAEIKRLIEEDYRRIVADLDAVRVAINAQIPIIAEANENRPENGQFCGVPHLPVLRLQD